MRERHKTGTRGISYRLVDESRPNGDRRYIVHYAAGDGRWHSETLPEGNSLSDAKDRLASLRVRKARGDRLVKTKMTVAELLDNWLETRRHSLKASTLETYEWGIGCLKEHMGHRKIQELSAADVADLRSRLRNAGHKTWTIKKIETPLSGAVRLAMREEWIVSNPFDRMLPHERLKPDQREMRCLPRESIPKLIESASSTRWKTLFAVLTFTGLRISEALSLEWTDVDLVNSGIVVRKSKTKAGERSVMLIPAIRNALAALKLQQTPGHQFIFSNATGAPVSRREALRALNAAEKRAGLPRYTLHELRHTFASILIAQGELPTFVASQMGHADPGVTMKTYAHLFEKEESMQRATDRLQAAFGGVL